MRVYILKLDIPSVAVGAVLALPQEPRFHFEWWELHGPHLFPSTILSPRCVNPCFSLHDLGDFFFKR
jgi:hypothetical protein